MYKNTVISYQWVAEEPVYRILSLFSVIVLVLWMTIAMLHNMHYQSFDANFGMLIPALTYLFILFGFSDKLVFDHKGYCFYYARRFYITKEMQPVEKLSSHVDKKYARIDVKSGGKLIKTGMIYKKLATLRITDPEAYQKELGLLEQKKAKAK